jgi:hypothetical protein
LGTIEERIKGIEAKIESLAQVTTVQANEQRTARVIVFPAPKRTHKPATDLAIIFGFIKHELADLDNSKIQGIMKLLGEVALSACNAFETDHEPEAAKPRGSLTSQYQMEMCAMMFRELTLENDRLSFIGDYVHLWPCKWMIQSKWTNKTKYTRSRK